MDRINASPEVPKQLSKYEQMKALNRNRRRNKGSIGSIADANVVMNTEGVSLKEQVKLQENIKKQQEISKAQVRALGVSQQPNLGTISE
jgi:hypothetical protein